MSQNNQQNDDNQAIENPNNSGHDNHQVLGPWTGKLKKAENQMMQHDEKETIVLNHADPEDPNAPRQIVNKVHSR